MEISGTRIIAQSLPCGKHLVLARGGQRKNVGETPHEAHVVVVALSHPRLLQYYLRNPDAIGVGGVAPGQTTPVPPVPRFDGLGKGMARGVGRVGRQRKGGCGVAGQWKSLMRCSSESWQMSRVPSFSATMYPSSPCTTTFFSSVACTMQLCESYRLMSGPMQALP